MLLVAAFLLAIFVLPSPWGVLVVGAAAFVEVAESYFWIRVSRRRRVQFGPETLVGATAEAATPCRPEGQVRLDGELWQARCEAGADAGDTVLVTGRDGLMLLVESADPIRELGAKRDSSG